MLTEWKILSVRLSRLESKLGYYTDFIDQSQRKYTVLEKAVTGESQGEKEIRLDKISEVSRAIERRVLLQEPLEKARQLCRGIQSSAAVCRAEEQVMGFYEKHTALSERMKALADQFANHYMEHLLQRGIWDNFENLESFENFICREAGIDLSDVRKGETVEDRFGKDFFDQLKRATEFMADVVPEKASIRWLMCYQMILNSLVKQSARRWQEKYPHFQRVKGREAALGAFVHLGLEQHSEDSFQLASWLFCREERPVDFFGFEKGVQADIPRVQKNDAHEQFREFMMQGEGRPGEEGHAAAITIEQMDECSEAEFERIAGALFAADGYQVKHPFSVEKDGAAILLERDGITIGILCESGRGLVGAAAVRRAVREREALRLNKVMVLTNGGFTAEGREAAEAADVLLFGRESLAVKIGLL